MEDNRQYLSDKTRLKKKTQFRVILGRLSHSKLAMFGLITLAVFVIIAIIAPWVIPYRINEMNPSQKLQGPSTVHWFGTDNLGRDMLSRLLYGTRYSLSLSFLAVLFGLIGGVIVGAVAGYFGGVVDQTIMRICDVIQAIPAILLNITIVVVLGMGFFNTILALGFSSIANNARMMRASILKVRKMDYLDAACVINCPTPRIIIKHVLPNAFSPMIVSSTMAIGQTILSAAGLSYLGLGVPTGTPEWGAMLSAGRDYITKDIWLTVFPGLFIMIVVLAVNLFGDGLRDAMDPRLKK